MNKSRKWISMALAALTLAGMAVFHAPEAGADVRIVRSRSHHGHDGGYRYGGGHCAPVYRPPVHCHSYGYQERRSFVGYDHCGRPIYQIYYVKVRTCGCR